VSENSDNCGDGFNFSRMKDGDEPRSNPSGKCNSGCSFDHVESKGRCAEAFSTGT